MLWIPTDAAGVAGRTVLTDALARIRAGFSEAESVMVIALNSAEWRRAGKRVTGV